MDAPFRKQNDKGRRTGNFPSGTAFFADAAPDSAGGDDLRKPGGRK